MAADLHIHVATDVSEADFACFFSSNIGSKWFQWQGPCKEIICEHWGRIVAAPAIWIGEVSWLKAALFEAPGEFIPIPVQTINELIGEDLPELTNELAERILNALGEDNATQYQLAKRDEVGPFLKEHIGKRIFTVSW